MEAPAELSMVVDADGAWLGWAIVMFGAWGFAVRTVRN